MAADIAKQQKKMNLVFGPSLLAPLSSLPLVPRPSSLARCPSPLCRIPTSATHASNGQAASSSTSERA